ncbi:BatA domain-containing protein [uncultured Polaribacter sp.]|uniref:BatA domain-containing protein n=1 Tax=uncultured Polaribacter sp. TaxID=174711 RepID=UPI0026187837|nr:BatA domain-containing protein [uncultured Polaribacter sp.]
MQFKNPEILYFLSLLITPILVHLFQLQKFIKVPFTNVAFLKKLEQHTRKSSQIKKWLILATRLLLFSAIILAFAQPYFGNKKAEEKQHNFIYLDNSLSTNTKGEKGDLLKIAAQEIIENTQKEISYSLLTNTNFYKNITKDELKNTLLNIENTTKTLNLNTVFLKIKQEEKNKTKTLNKNILISDFQGLYTDKFTDVTPSFKAIQLTPTVKNNISIDSVFVSDANNTNFVVNTIIKNQGSKIDNVPLALFNKEKLLSKQSFFIDKDEQKTIKFTIQNEPEFLGKLEVNFSDTFSFDNRYFFTINNQTKTNILAIGENLDYLAKIYTKNEFNLTKVSLLNLNYSSIEKQQLIVLNELKNIPEILAKSLQQFHKNGGNIILIPNEEISLNSYNNFLKKCNLNALQNKTSIPLKITKINYNHPVFDKVFSKQVNNFQYPNLKSHYPISGKTIALVSLENNTAFISELKNNFYYVTGALNKKNSNFLNSPLIVPIFYNLGKMSFKYPKIAYRLQKENNIEIDTKIGKDEILTLSGTKEKFIPLQKTYQNKVAIITKEQPLTAGFYSVLKEDFTLQNLAFNNPKEESLLKYIDLKTLQEQNKSIEISSSIANVFKKITKNNEVQWLWKWFLGLAVVSLLLEIFILKFFKS